MPLKKQTLLPAITLAIAVNCGMIGIDQLSLPAISKAPSKGKEESKGNDKAVQESFVQTIQKLEKARPYTKQSLETALGAKLDAPVSDFMTCSGFKQKPIALVKLFWSEHSMGPVVLMLDGQNTITLPIIKVWWAVSMHKTQCWVIPIRSQPLLPRPLFLSQRQALPNTNLLVSPANSLA